MTSIDDIYGTGKYLKADDVTAGQVVTIKATRMETFMDGVSKVILTFNETDKELALNKTNAGKMSEIAGSKDWSLWSGKKLKLIITSVDYKGTPTPAIRLEAVV